MARSVFLLPLLLAALSASTAVHAKDDPQLWLSASTNIKLGSTLRLSQETISRFSDNRDGLYEIENGLLLGYQLNRHVTAWAGYVHDPLYNAGHFTTMEHRAREQVTIDDLLKIGPGKLSVRVRLEQRWREGLNGTGWRVRPFARYIIPLDKAGRTTLHFSHESFIDLNTTGFQTVAGEERMRNLVAIRTRLVKGLNLEAGYLNQYGILPGQDDHIDHVASLAVSLSF